MSIEQRKPESSIEREAKVERQQNMGQDARLEALRLKSIDSKVRQRIETTGERGKANVSRVAQLREKTREARELFLDSGNQAARSEQVVDSSKSRIQALRSKYLAKK